MNTKMGTIDVGAESEDASEDTHSLRDVPEVEVHESNEPQNTTSHLRVGDFIPLQEGLTPTGKINDSVRFDGRVNPFTPFNNHSSHHNQRSIIEDDPSMSRNLSIGRSQPATTLSRKEAGMPTKWRDTHAPVLRSPRLARSRPASLPVPKTSSPRKTGGGKKVVPKVVEVLTPEEQKRRQLLVAEAQRQLDRKLLEEHVLKIETATRGIVGLLETLKASEETKERIRKCISALHDAFH